ncbi:MAG: hypothetical protein R2873_11410 [Caldilineaceae bacterium]|nr:hypothetical protein [Caldilineaceae bacterium]
MHATRKTHRLSSFLFFVLAGTGLLYFAQLTPAQAATSAQRTLPDGTVQIYLPVVETEPTATSTPTATPTSVPTATPTATDIPTPACPTTSNRQFEMIPVLPPPADHPDDQHGDLNLALRGYVETSAQLGLIDINGAFDPGAPQFPGLFADGRTPSFTSAHRVYDWNWACGEHGCRGDELTPRDVTLLGMGADQGEAISFPSRGAQIYGGGFVALVLYASEERITLGYTRDDSVAPGYTVHLESVCVDPNLLALYRQANLAGRGNLPALRNGDVLGTVKVDELLAAVRDRGTFMDPRTRKDWWQGR